MENNIGNDIQNNIKKKNNSKFYIIIGILIVLIVLALTYIVYDKVINKQQPKEEPQINNNTQEIPKQETKEEIKIVNNHYTYDNYSLDLVNIVNNLDDVYAVDIRHDDSLDSNKDTHTYDIYVRYTDEKETKIATIKTNKNVSLEYRTLDVEDNKLYFIINSLYHEGTLFELTCIDLKNPNGVTKLNDFNKTFINDNKDGNSIYSSQIYVKDNYIYYTSLKDGNLKRYNIQTKTSENVLKNVEWIDYTIDKINNKIFADIDSTLYISNLDGSNLTKSSQGTNLNTGSDFWTNAYYNKKPLFRTTVKPIDDGVTPDIIDVYAFNYSNNSFVKVKGNIQYYKIKYNNIEILSKGNNKNDNLFVNSFFIGK